MTAAPLSPVLLSEQLEIQVEELVHATGLQFDEIVELVEYGVFEPSGNSPGQWRFAAHTIALGRRACRLREDFDLNLPALALVAGLLERIDDLEAEMVRLRAQLLR
jgi:chaperone modulatory protein CbpM